MPTKPSQNASVIDWSIARIEAADVIEKTLKHLGLDEASPARNRSPPAGWFDHSLRLF